MNNERQTLQTETQRQASRETDRNIQTVRKTNTMLMATFEALNPEINITNITRLINQLQQQLIHNDNVMRLTKDV